MTALAVTFAVERPTYWLLKNSFRRDRPANCAPIPLLIAHDKFSFPSGHTCAAFVFATVTSSYFPTLATPLFLWAAMIGVSRIVVGVHYPTDIMAGMGLGLLLSEWTLTLV
nr:phosphatase PAP2 family protein [Idiomarina seosinensis]